MTLRDKLLHGLAAVALMTAPAMAFAANPTNSAASETPGHAMQEHGAKPGYPAASGYAPGQELKQGSRDTDAATLGSAERKSDGANQVMTDTQSRTDTDHTRSTNR